MKAFACVLAAGLAIVGTAGMSAVAQSMDSLPANSTAPETPLPQDDSGPRVILPNQDGMDAMPVPDAMPDNSDTAPAPISGLARGNAPAVVVGDLGTLEGPVAGTLDDTNGGLGYNAWQSADRATVETMLATLPPSTPSAASRLLMRKLLLTAAPPPPGRADHSFNALRITTLIAAGLADDAADLAVGVQAPMNAEIRRAQADAFLYAARDTEACGDATAYRLESAEPFWVELRAYCYAITGDLSALDLTRSVIQEQGTADPAFLALLDGIVSGKANAPDSIPVPDSLHVLMLSRLKLPMTVEIGTTLGLTPSLIAAASRETPRVTRIGAAEKALRAGALPTLLLAQVLDLTRFTPQELNGAPAIARVEHLMNALARLRAALKAATAPDARAEIVHTAFEVADREGLLRQIALLFADDAAAISPSSDWGNWSELMIRGLLLAEKPQAAELWYEVLDPSVPGASQIESQLQLALALAAPNPARMRASVQTLSDLAVQALPPVQAQSDDPSVRPPPRPSQTVIARATLDIGLFDALGRQMSQDARAAVQPLVMQASPGRRPPAVLMQRIDQASLNGSRGELALSVVAAMGSQGAADLAPDVVVRLVRALQTGGMRDAAQILALESLLLRPAGG